MTYHDENYAGVAAPLDQLRLEVSVLRDHHGPRDGQGLLLVGTRDSELPDALRDSGSAASLHRIRLELLPMVRVAVLEDVQTHAEPLRNDGLAILVGSQPETQWVHLDRDGPVVQDADEGIVVHHVIGPRIPDHPAASRLAFADEVDEEVPSGQELADPAEISVQVLDGRPGRPTHDVHATILDETSHGLALGLGQGDSRAAVRIEVHQDIGDPLQDLLSGNLVPPVEKDWLEIYSRDF